MYKNKINKTNIWTVNINIFWIIQRLYNIRKNLLRQRYLIQFIDTANTFYKNNLIQAIIFYVSWSEYTKDIGVIH